MLRLLHFRIEIANADQISSSETISSPFLFFYSVFFAIFKPPRTRPSLQPLTGCAARSLDFILDCHRRLGFPSRSPLQLAAHVPLGVFRMPVAFCWQAEGENGTPPRTVEDTNGSPVRLDNHFRYRQAHAGAWHAIPYILSSIEFLEDMLDFLFFNPRPLVRNTNVMELVMLLRSDRDGLSWRRVELRVGDQVN